MALLSRILHHGCDREVDAALEVHRIGAGRNGLHALANNRLGENGCGRGAVASDVIGLGRDLAHHLRAHVLELVLKLDLLGDGDAVLRDARSAEGLVEHDVAAFRAERNLHSIRKNIYATQHPLAGILGKTYVFSSHIL